MLGIALLTIALALVFIAALPTTQEIILFENSEEDEPESLDGDDEQRRAA